jgi:hypothetical protein
MMVPITSVDVDVGADGVALLGESTMLQELPQIKPAPWQQSRHSLRQ